ncbi:MAG: methyltransferase family protein [Bacteroidota bacterium]
MNLGKTGTTNPYTSIKKNGLLGVVRHPMYFTLMVFLWSTIFTLMDLIVNTLLTIYVIIGTRLEEKKLVLEFGEAYVKYQHEVPMLVPFIKPRTDAGRLRPFAHN